MSLREYSRLACVVYALLPVPRRVSRSPHKFMQQVGVQTPTPAVDVTLLAFAAERRAAARAAAPLLVGARLLPLSIDIPRPHGAQQQTRRSRMIGQTDGRTLDRFH